MSFTGEEKRRAFGFHLMLDCYQCNPEHLDNIDSCYRFLDELVEITGATKQTQPYVFRTPDEFEGKEGLSGWVPLVESGISIHTLITNRFISLDVYSCKEFNRESVIEFTRQFFEPAEIEQQFLLRGLKYH
ncbi:S-adenosylmethionine decarboxylase [Candidatus Electrothrix laxa]